MHAENCFQQAWPTHSTIFLSFTPQVMCKYLGLSLQVFVASLQQIPQLSHWVWPFSSSAEQFGFVHPSCVLLSISPNHQETRDQSRMAQTGRVQCNAGTNIHLHSHNVGTHDIMCMHIKGPVCRINDGWLTAVEYNIDNCVSIHV